jgi:brefeldin A-inhibited guanine nucleotide-exchange protein 3
MYICGSFRLFDDAALKLNLQALTGFLAALVAASQVQLFSTFSQHTGSSSNPGPAKLWWPRRAQSPRGSTGPLSGDFQLLLLHRVGDVMLKTVRSGRPLIHVMRAWSVVGPHLMEVTQPFPCGVTHMWVHCLLRLEAFTKIDKIFFGNQSHNFISKLALLIA